MNSTFNVYMKMEDSTELTWIGSADDERHAVGKAFTWATERTGEQVYDYDVEEEAV